MTHHLRQPLATQSLLLSTGDVRRHPKSAGKHRPCGSTCPQTIWKCVKYVKSWAPLSLNNLTPNTHSTSFHTSFYIVLLYHTHKYVYTRHDPGIENRDNRSWQVENDMRRSVIFQAPKPLRQGFTYYGCLKLQLCYYVPVFPDLVQSEARNARWVRKSIIDRFFHKEFHCSDAEQVHKDDNKSR